ncbi:hypothetical protein [Vannielia litorea]|uniref:hypothetical protein n=1 Tax=Vannielia litorea TaxID=1217970 RepID=UPI001BD01FA4|nr:hypothetical protein [Vannielia litorea]MBS8227139.1 hypothetical protein [Vannielia litorea]
MFGLGFIIGGLAGAAGIIALAVQKARSKPPQPLAESSADKLRVARRYLGQIANRESIREARKIANKALRVTE